MEHVLDPNAGDVGQGVRHAAQQGCLIRRRSADGRDKGVRGAFEEARAGDHREVDRQRPPGNVAQAGDRQVDVAAENIHPDDVADADAPALGQSGVKGNQRFSGVILWPPGPGGQMGSFRHRGRIGQATVAAQRPLGFRGDLQLFDRHALHRHDPCPQVGHLLRGGDAGLGGKQSLEFWQLILLDVDEKEARRLVGDLIQDFPADIALDQRHGGQGGQA